MLLGTTMMTTSTGPTEHGDEEQTPQKLPSAKGVETHLHILLFDFCIARGIEFTSETCHQRLHIACIAEAELTLFITRKALATIHQSRIAYSIVEQTSLTLK